MEVWGGVPIGQTGWLLGAFALAFVMRKLLGEARSALACSFADRAAASLASALEQAAFAGGPALVARIGRPAFATLLVDGIDEVREYLALAVPKAVCMVLVPLVLVIAIFVLDAVSGLIALVCFPFIIVFMRLIGRGAKEEAARTHAGFLRMANHFMDSVHGLRTLKAFGRSRAHADRVFASSEAYRRLTMRNLRIGTLSSTVLDIFATCGLAAVAIMLGFRLVEGAIAFLPALSVLMLVPEYFAPIKAYAKDYHATLEGKAALALADGLIEEQARAEACTRARIEASGMQEARTRGFRTLAFEGISFSYPGEAERAIVLPSFEVVRGATVGVLGPSGSGKSTLLRLVAGLDDPLGGRILLDGEEAGTLRRPEWRSGVSLIPQDPFVLSASVRDNVSLYAPDASDARIRTALAEVGLAELLSELAEGLDARLGEGGRALSGGEAQRLCLARSLLDVRRSIWVLDEPTARLDQGTERALIETIMRVRADRTLFVATHSAQWSDAFDVRVQVGREA